MYLLARVKYGAYAAQKWVQGLARENEQENRDGRLICEVRPHLCIKLPHVPAPKRRP